VKVVLHPPSAKARGIRKRSASRFACSAGKTPVSHSGYRFSDTGSPSNQAPFRGWVSNSDFSRSLLYRHATSRTDVPWSQALMTHITDPVVMRRQIEMIT